MIARKALSLVVLVTTAVSCSVPTVPAQTKNNHGSGRPPTGHPAPAQAKRPDFKILATYRLGTETLRVSRQEVALELGRTLRMTKAGHETLTHLIERRVVECAARQHKLMPKADVVNKRVAEIEREMRNFKQDLSAHLRRQRMTPEIFRAHLALAIAQERLVLLARGDSTDRRLTKRETQSWVPLWIKEATAKAKVEKDPNNLATGIAAKVNDTEILLSDVGDTLFMRVSQKQVEDAVKELVFRRVVDDMAKRSKITLSKGHFDAYLERIKERHATNPKFKGITFPERLMAERGINLREFIEGPYMRAQVQFSEIVERRIDDASLEDYMAKNPAEMKRRHGGRRKLSVLLMRAARRPTKLVKRDFDTAKRDITQLRQQLARFPQRFPILARKHSDHPTRVKGGSVGWKHEADPTGSIGPEVLAAAFKTPIGQITQPIRQKDGFYLVKVDAIEAQPDRALMKKRLRSQFIQAMLRQMHKQTAIQMKL